MRVKENVRHLPGDKISEDRQVEAEEAGKYAVPLHPDNACVVAVQIHRVPTRPLREIHFLVDLLQEVYWTSLDHQKIPWICHPQNTVVKTLNILLLIVNIPDWSWVKESVIRAYPTVAKALVQMDGRELQKGERGVVLVPRFQLLQIRL